MTRTLDAAAYWKLRAICSEAQRCELLALTSRDALAAAHKKQEAALVELGLDPKAPSFTLDDDTLTVAVPDSPHERRLNESHDQNRARLSLAATDQQ